MSKHHEEALDRADNTLVAWLVAALRANIPENELPAEARVPAAQEFLEFIGRFQELLAGILPSPAKGAALLFVTQSLNLDKVEDAPARQMLTLVEAMRRLQESLRSARLQVVQ